MHHSELIYSGSISFADGISWAIAAEDSFGAEFGQTLAESMQLTNPPRAAQKLLILKNGLLDRGIAQNFISEKNLFTLNHDNHITCQVNPAVKNDFIAIQLTKLSLVFCAEAEDNGGLLVHGALAEKDGQGLILAGPGDVGKTTASRRLPPPWKSLSDDCTLIVRDSNGIYHAHPWPTWSSFMFGGGGGSWDVQYSVPLKNIFFLEQSVEDRTLALGQGEAACLLTETAEHAWLGPSLDMEPNVRRKLNLQRFENICEMVKTIPAFILQITKDGSFWKEINKVL